MPNKRFELPPTSVLPEAETDPFRRFDNLFKAVIAVPKAAIDKQEAKYAKARAKSKGSRRQHA
jgi:hypothetical protein